MIQKMAEDEGRIVKSVDQKRQKCDLVELSKIKLASK
jgi:hypothetical protein